MAHRLLRRPDRERPRPPRAHPEQRAVIEAPLRPLLVVAGAGSGKTETMAARVVWLVANGHVEPDQVLGLTFTRKAATELSERIARRLRRLRRRRALDARARATDGAEVLGGTPDRLDLPLVCRPARARARAAARASSPSPGCSPRRPPGSSPPRWSTRYDGPMDDVDKRRGDRHRPPWSTSPARWPSTSSTPDDVERHLDDVRGARLARCPRARAGHGPAHGGPATP